MELNRICKYTEQLSLEKISNTSRDTGQMMSQTVYTGKIHFSLADTKSTRKKTQRFLLHSKEEHEVQQYIRKEIYRDNCDIRVNVGHMTKQNQTKDYHWFISLAADWRVEGHGLNEQRPQLPISELKNRFLSFK